MNARWRSFFWRVAIFAFALVVTIGVYRIAIGNDDGDDGFHPPHENAQMLRVLRANSGQEVVGDNGLVDDLSGDQRVGDALVSGAFCVAGLDWLADIVLTPEMIVAADPALTRAAELYADAIAADDLPTAALIARVEQAYWGHDADVDRLEDWADGITDDNERAAVRQYLDERQQPPSNDARDRVVIYAVRVTTWEQRVYYLDTARIQPSRLARPASDPTTSDVLVAGEDELRTLDLADCDDLARDWGRYDSSLPELPPIAERWQLELDQTV